MIPLRIRNNFFRTKFFWSVQKWFNDHPSFWLQKTVFQGRHAFSKTKGALSLFFSTLPTLLSAIVYAALFIVLVELWNQFNISSWLLNLFHLSHLSPIIQRFDVAAVDTLLATVASVMGVFLALYFMAISSVTSSLLIKAHQDIREFFLAQPKGQQYVSIVALTGIISIFYIITKALGYYIPSVGLIGLFILASYVISRFWSVGRAAFSALEPTNSFPSITQDIADIIRNIIPSGLQWDKPAIQNHNGKIARQYINLIQQLLSFGMHTLQWPNKELLRALKYINGLLVFYAERKKMIPTFSLWYETKHKHKNWIFADFTQLSIALNTGTQIRPETIKDYTWFEERLLNIGMDILQVSVGKRDIEFAVQGTEVFVNTIESFAKDFDVPNAELLLKKLEPIFNQAGRIRARDIKANLYKTKLALMDSQGRLATAALLGLVKYIDEQSGDRLSETISKISWTSDRKLHSVDLPSAIFHQLESISEKVKNELTIEGKRVSPNWYITALCVQAYLFALKKYFDFIKSLHSNHFKKEFDNLIKKREVILASHLAERWLEFSNKYCRLIDRVGQHIEDCLQFKKIKDLPWVIFDKEKEQKIGMERENEVVDNMVKLLPQLKSISVTDELPDYFGHALTVGVQACYEACRDNDVNRLKLLFPILLTSSLVAYDMTRQKVQDWTEDDSKIAYSSEPLSNLFELSGYAKIYSEMHQNTALWDAVKVPWDTYLSSFEADKAVRQMGAVMGYRKTIFAVMPQAGLRATWQQELQYEMKESGLPVFPDDRHSFHGDRLSVKNIKHTSPLIRVIAGSGSLVLGLDFAQDIFVATYLSQHPASLGVKFSDKHEWQERIQREELLTEEVGNGKN